MDTSNLTGFFIATILISFLLFLVLRQLNTWYWKINERIRLQWKTNILLEKLLVQSGCTDADEITIEEIKTGKKKKIKIDGFIELVATGAYTDKYRMIRDDIAKNPAIIEEVKPTIKKESSWW